ncbi:unnamed protein product [Rotaria sp. Silwood1]|nr:unnamed protein product [Rotaria sp. Silwood1]
MESDPSSTGDLTQEHEQLIFVNNQVKKKKVKLQSKKPAKKIFITPQRIGTYEKQKKKKGDAGHQLEQIIFGGRVVSMVSSKDKRASFTIDALVVSDDVNLGYYQNKMNGLYLINHQCPSRYTNEFIQQCTNLDDLKILKSDHYGLATLTNLNAMNNMINLDEQVEHNEADNNIRPYENYLNCYADADDSESSTTSSNSSDEDDVDLSIWNDKDSNIEYSSSDDDDEEDNKLINKETE